MTYPWDRQRRRTRQVGGTRPSPIFLAILALFLAAGIALWLRVGPLGVIAFVFVLAGWTVSLCLHEYAHAVTAYHGGDRGIVDKGYLTLNPVRYAHPILSIVLPLVFVLLGGIGFPGGAVWVDRHALRSKRTESLVAAAGPLTNVGFTLLIGLGVAFLFDFARIEFWSAFAFLCLLQLTASLLNLLPVPGLDGFGIISPWLQPRTQELANKFAPFTMLVVFGILIEPRLNWIFFKAVYFLLRLVGVPLDLVGYGSSLFRFWSS